MASIVIEVAGGTEMCNIPLGPSKLKITLDGCGKWDDEVNLDQTMWKQYIAPAQIIQIRVTEITEHAHLTDYFAGEDGIAKRDLRYEFVVKVLSKVVCSFRLLLALANQAGSW